MTDQTVFELIGQGDRQFGRSNGLQAVSKSFFRLLVLLAAFSYFAVWTTGYLRGLITIISVPLLLALLIARPLPRGRFILQLSSVFALLQAVLGAGGVTPGVVLLLQFAGLTMFFQIFVLDTLRAAHGVIILSLMMILAVAAMNVNFLFPVVLLPYILVFYVVLRHLAILRHQATAAKTAVSGPSAPPDLKRRAIGTLVSVIIFAFLWLVMFYLIPRTGSFGIASEASQRRLHGFGNSMDLGGIGLLEDNPAVVMRLRPLEEKTFSVSVLRRIGGKLLRGATFAWYKAGKWEKATRRRWYMNLRGNYGELRLIPGQFNQRDLHQLEILPENMDPPVIFLPDRTVNAQFEVPYIAYEEDLSFYFLYRPGMTRRYVVNVLLSPEEPEDSLIDEIEKNHEVLPYLSKMGIPPRVKSLASDLIGSNATISARVAAVMSYLRGQYGYSLVQESLDGIDPVENFLFEAKEGSCEHFASSMVLLLRAMDIPARPVGGYTMGEWNEIGGFYTIRQRHAHAWVEVYFPRSGWIPFDPTPPIILTGPETEVERLLQVLWETYEGFWFRYVYSFDNRIQGLGFKKMLDAAADTFSSLGYYLWQPYFWLLLSCLSLLAYFGLRRRKKYKSQNCWLPDWYSAWEESLPVPRFAWETPAEYHQRLLMLEVVEPGYAKSLAGLADLVDRSAFSPQPDHSEIQMAARALIADLAQAMPFSSKNIDT